MDLVSYNFILLWNWSQSLAAASEKTVANIEITFRNTSSWETGNLGEMGMSNKWMRLTKQDGYYKESVWYAIVATLPLQMCKKGGTESLEESLP